ncbi:unnamed protein product, partial [marine sediment metagenome]
VAHTALLSGSEILPVPRPTVKLRLNRSGPPLV